RVGHPDPVLLIDAEVKGSHERLAGLDVAAFADDLSVLVVAAREKEKLALVDSDRPDVAAGRHGDALHESELSAERDALRGRQRLSILVENRDRLAAVTRQPRLVLRVDCRAERPALHAAAGESGRDGRKRLAVGIELRRVPLPECILRLPADREVVANP